MSSSDVACAVSKLTALGRSDAFFILSLWRPARERIVDPEYEVRHSGIAVRAAERWNCVTC